MDTQNSKYVISPSVKQTRWWLRASVSVAGVVVITTIVSLYFGSFGPFTSPVKFFLEEIILEELLGIGDFFYFTYPYSLGFITAISALFYAFTVGVIVWGVERHKVGRSVTVLSAVAAILAFMWTLARYGASI